MNYIPPVPLVLKFLTNLNLNIEILIPLALNNNLFGPVSIKLYSFGSAFL